MSLTGYAMLLVGLIAGRVVGTQVELPYGTVSGNLHQASREFLGIPFAARPTRFMPPSPWTARYPDGHLEAKQYTPVCMQAENVLTPATAGYSEDCLHLNVYAPTESPEDGTAWPVMVWIHGGALTTGSAMVPLYNGSNLAVAEKVVVVAMNYRLNVFGFSVMELSGGHPVANNGFRDQREGLRWVRKHIGSFGGDPRRVTIFGESAGGQSTATHILTLGSKGLFDRAIAESGDMLNVADLATGRAVTQLVAQELGCRSASASQELACLQNVDKDALVKATNGSGPGAVIDMDVYEADPLTLIAQSAFNKVPFVFGNNANEGNLFVYPGAGSNTTLASASDIRCAVRKAFGEEVGEKVLQIYAPVETPGVDNRQVAADIFGDTLFHCDNRKVAQALAKAGVAPWVYSFNRQPSCSAFPGAAHGVEIAYVFQNLDVPLIGNSSVCTASSEDYALSAKVSSLWAGFARTGVMEKEWPRFESPAYEINLKIDLGLVEAFDTEIGAHRSHCDAMERIGALKSDLLGAQVVGALTECQGDAHASERTVFVV